MSCGVCGREFCDSQADVDSLVDCQRLGIARLRSALAAAEKKAELWACREGALVERGIRTDADQLSQLQAAEAEIERLKAENASLWSMATALGKQCAELERDRNYNAELLAAAEQRNTELQGALRAADCVMWMALAYADGGGSRSIEMEGYRAARTAIDAALHDEERSAPGRAEPPAGPSDSLSKTAAQGEEK